MSGYRFCRSDDVPLLVRAYNECYRVHFPELAPLTIDGFKRAVREVNLWSSSCMVAFIGDRPIAVLLGAKRETENCLLAVGVHPGHQRQGHGRHMLGSLSQKMAILGPPRLLAEAPAADPAVRFFLETCGYTRERTYTDYVRQPDPSTVAPHDLIQPITVEELLKNDALDRQGPRPWERAPETLINRGDRLQGIAIASDQRIEAHLLYDDTPPDERHILAFHTHTPALLRHLLDHCTATTPRPIRIPKLTPQETPPLLSDCGFHPTTQTLSYSATAAPA